MLHSIRIPVLVATLAGCGGSVEALTVAPVLDTGIEVATDAADAAPMPDTLAPDALDASPARDTAPPACSVMPEGSPLCGARPRPVTAYDCIEAAGVVEVKDCPAFRWFDEPANLYHVTYCCEE